ncbi:hypothetical protein L1889_07860 [Paenalcaligenes niemegkensis]|uniref:hypothetical protein n=1 Tax=Paenalcaligenes niemegkensis TaxID=2895469 RepID=UPI001EE8C867|nr:hypothetical protein [Paenalcaligenes niemegkensis]MCQ9616633.1 hypothetical protein [Paenalcaligenes niemegkensis]
MQYRLTATGNGIQDIIFGNAAEQIAAGLELDTALPGDRDGTLYLNTDQLNGFSLGSVKVAAANSITVENDLSVGHAGEITLYGPQVNVNADLTAHSGSIHLGNVLNQIGTVNTNIQDVVLNAPAGTTAGVTVAEGVTLNTSGVWSNLLLDPTDTGALPYQNGGNISIRSSGDITLSEGSLLDVSSGAALLADGSQQGGRGGDVTLAASRGSVGGSLIMDGEIHGYGVNGGGNLQIETGSMVVISEPPLLEHAGFLEAGQAAPINLRLDEPYAVAGGETLLLDTDFSQVIAGQILPSEINFEDTGQTVNIVLGPGGWDLTGTDMDVHINGSNTASNRYRGHTGTRTVVPEGAVITRIRGGTLPEGYVIPGSLGSLPTPTYTVSAGQPAPMDTQLPAGTVLGQRVAVQSFLTLAAAYFNKGFGYYEVVGQQGVIVAEGAEVNVSMPVLRLSEQARGLATGGPAALALEQWVPPLYQHAPIKRQLTQRAGASLALQAGTSLSTADDMASVVAQVGRGAVINVDPGQSIELRSIGQLTVDGTLNAWGGQINLGSVAVSSTVSEAVEGAGHDHSIWLGENAVLGVAARAVVGRDAQGRRYGQVTNGGSIVIGGEFDHATSEASASPLLWWCATARCSMPRAPAPSWIYPAKVPPRWPAMAAAFPWPPAMACIWTAPCGLMLVGRTPPAAA